MAIAKLSTEDGPVHLGDVARHCGISRKYLEQLVTPLRNASLLRALSGRGGGYELSREPSEIKINDIIKAAVGPIEVTECAIDKRNCLLSDFCSCRYLWALINHRVTQVLDEYSLADLLNKDWAEKVKEELSSVS